MATTDLETFEPYNLGTLKELFKKMYARGGDSDFDDTLAGVYLNAAEKYIVSRVGAPKWLQCVKTITLVASTSEYNMDLSVQDIHYLDQVRVRAEDQCGVSGGAVWPVGDSLLAHAVEFRYSLCRLSVAPGMHDKRFRLPRDTHRVPLRGAGGGVDVRGRV